MRKRICAYPMCKRLIDPHERYCPEHKRDTAGSNGNRKPFENAARSNTGLYNTARWKRLRKKHLEENGYCIYCGSAENLTVDHITAPRGDEDLFFSPGNLQTLCPGCHSFKTAKEINERRGRRPWRRRRGRPGRPANR
jgi:5-methylcytosine-specific restriction endonuclease McrA